DPRFQLLEGHALRLTGDTQGAREILVRLAREPLPDKTYARLLMRDLEAVGQFFNSLDVLASLYEKWGDADARRELARRLLEADRNEELAKLLASVDLADANSSTELLALRGLALGRLGRSAQLAALRQALAGRRQDPTAP